MFCILWLEKKLKIYFFVELNCYWKKTMIENFLFIEISFIEYSLFVEIQKEIEQKPFHQYSLLFINNTIISLN